MDKHNPDMHELKMIDFCRFIFLRGIKLGFTLGKGDRNDPIFEALAKLHSPEFIESLKSEATRDHLSEANGMIFDHDLNDLCLTTIRQVMAREVTQAEKDGYDAALKDYLDRREVADRTARESGF